MRLPLLATTFLAAPALLAACTSSEAPPPEVTQAAPVSSAAVAPVAPAPRPHDGTPAVQAGLVVELLRP